MHPFISYQTALQRQADLERRAVTWRPDRPYRRLRVRRGSGWLALGGGPFAVALHWRRRGGESRGIVTLLR